MAMKDWRKRISGSIVSYYKDNMEIMIIYDYLLFKWKVVLLRNGDVNGNVQRLGRTEDGGLKGKQQAINIAKKYMRKH